MPVNPATLGGNTGPSLNLNFLSGTLDPRFTFTRASSATYFDATGTLQSASTNIPRFDYGPVPGGVTNWIRNNSNIGAVIGTPGTLPTNWTQSGSTGLSANVVATGNDNGIPFVDFQIVGTTATGTVNDIIFEGATVIAASPSDVWTPSVYCKLQAGTLTNVSSIRSNISAVNSGGTNVVTTQQTITPTAASLNTQRNSQTVTMTDATTAFVRSFMRITFSAAPVAVDLTLRIGGVQLERASSVGVLVLTTSAAVNVGATPLGLLMEEARTNSVSNNSNTGAVVGTPGTLPTNWSVSGLGAATSVIAFGTENGIPYVDVNFNGTTTSAGQIFVQFETAITAVAAQLWTGSAYLRLIAGDFTNVTATGVQVNVSGGTGSIRTSATPTSAALSSQRTNAVITAGTGATAVIPFFVGTVASGVAINFSIRIGAAQLELGAFQTSPILTTAGTVTRTTENASMPWLTGTAYSFAVEAETDGSNIYTANQFLIHCDDGSANNRTAIYRGTTGFATGLTVAAGVTILQVSGSLVSQGTVCKTTVGHADGINKFTHAGALSSNTTFGTVARSTLLRLGASSGGTSTLNGYLRRVRYWPRLLSDIEAQRESS